MEIMKYNAVPFSILQDIAVDNLSYFLAFFTD